MKTRPALLLILLAGCSGGAPAAPPGALAIADTVLQSSNALVGAPVELTVGTDGALYITDGAQAQVLVTDSTGAILRRIGRRGQGPGEMQQPRDVFAFGDTVRVGDAAGDQVHVFTSAGDYVRSIHGFWGLAIAQLAIGPDGGGVAAQHGRQGAPAVRFAPDGTPGDTLGHADPPLQLGFDFRALKHDLLEGKVPAALLTYTSPAVAPDGSAWVSYVVAGRIERYSDRDSLLWSAALPDSLLTRLRATLVEGTRRDTTPAGIMFPSVIAVTRPVGDTLWLLLHGERRGLTTIARLSPEGDWLPPIHVTGAGEIGSFAVDPTQRWLYLLDRGEGTVVRVRLSPG